MIKILSAIGTFFRRLFENLRTPESELAAETGDYMTHIMGKPLISAEKIAAYMISKNPDAADYAHELAQLYIEEGTYEGVRGDIAAAQAMLETGNLTFEGSAVTLDQNNLPTNTGSGMRGWVWRAL